MRIGMVSQDPNSAAAYTLLGEQPDNIGHNARKASSWNKWFHSGPKLSRLKLLSFVVLALMTTFVSVYKLAPVGTSVSIVKAVSQPIRTAPSEQATAQIPHVTSTVMTRTVKDYVHGPLHSQDVDEEDEEEEEGEVRDKIRYKHTKRRLPQCIIIGVRKAGTRALLSFLNLHPQIQTASHEVHFFDVLDNYNRGLEWYRKHMPYSFPDQVTMEKSPSYFTTARVAERVLAMNSSVKLLLILRNPVDRTVSDYLQIMLKNEVKGQAVRSFEDLVLLDTGELDTSYPPLRRSIYLLSMKQWLLHFNLSQFHFVDGEKLITDPVTELRAVEDFLGLEHRISKDNFYFNQTRGFFCIHNDTMEKCLSKSKGRSHPAIDPYVLEKMKDYFRSYNKHFFHLIKREFDWG